MDVPRIILNLEKTSFFFILLVPNSASRFLLPKWSCFWALGNIGFVASFDETPWFRSDFCLTRPCASFFRTSDRSSSATDLGGTASRQNIWKHRETLHFYMLLGYWNFCCCKKSIHVAPGFWNVYSLISNRFGPFRGCTSDSINSSAKRP